MSSPFMQRRINAEQRERLLDLVEKNKNVLFGNRSQGSVLKNQVWRDITAVLNKLGTEKTVDQWRKTWTDIKSAVKKKAAELRAINTTYGTDFPSEMQLSEEDYQVLRMCNIRIMDGIAETPAALSNLQKMNPAQRESMLENIEEYLSILCGPNTDKKLEKWSVIADILNTLGPKKSSENWRKTWIDMKKAVKRKVASIKAAGEGGQPSDGDLTEEDQRVIKIYESEALEYPEEFDDLSEALFDEPSMQSNDVRLENNTADSFSSFQSLPETSQYNVEMENLRWMNHTNTIINFQKSLKNDLDTCEITLAFNGKSVKAHRCVLSACSHLLRDVLRDVPTGQEATIIVPDTEGSLLDSVLNFIYMGETDITSTRLTEFLEAIGNLGIKSPISFDCANITVTNKELLETADIEQIEEDDELRGEIIDVDDEEDFTFVDHVAISQHDLIEDSSDEALTILNRSEKSNTDRSGSSTPIQIVKTADNDAVVLAEHLDMDSPMTEDYVDDPIGDGKQKTIPSRIKRESSDDDDDDDDDVDIEITDKIKEPQSFRDRVNRLRAQQKKSLKNAFLAHSKGGMSLRKAALTYNITRTALLREVTKHGSTTIFDSSDDEEENIKNDLIRLRKHIRIKSNPMDLPESQFTKVFGMPKEAFMYILDQVKNKLPEAKRSSSVPATLKLAATLKFLTEGSYQKGMGNDFALGLAQPTLSKILKDMLIAIESHICPQWIKSVYTEEEKMQAKLYFYKQAGIPGVIGCVKNTHVKILSPNQEQQRLYLNKKGFHSLNAMIVCDHRMFIRFVDANHPGANQDSLVWHTSKFRDSLKRNYYKGEKNTWLLGHAGYSLEPFLVTPFRKPEEGSNESNFNKKHLKTRNIIDKTIAILKTRFQCLLGEKQLHYTPQKSAQIVNVCVALHNICLHYNSVPEIDPNFENESDSDIEPDASTQIDQVAVDMRDHLLEAIQRLH